MTDAIENQSLGAEALEPSAACHQALGFVAGGCSFSGLDPAYPGSDRSLTLYPIPQDRLDRAKDTVGPPPIPAELLTAQASTNPVNNTATTPSPHTGCKLLAGSASLQVQRGTINRASTLPPTASAASPLQAPTTTPTTLPADRTWVA